MITLTVSIEEIFDLLKQNIKLPKVLAESSYEKGALSLAFDRKEGAKIPLTIDFGFSGHDFDLTANSGTIQSLANMTFGVGELLEVLKKSIKKPAKFMQSLQYDEQAKRFHLTLEPKKPPPGKQPSFQGPIKLQAALERRADDTLGLEIVPAG